MKKPTRKPFVVPQIKEEASLVGVTLVSGNNPTRDGSVVSRTPQGDRVA